MSREAFVADIAANSGDGQAADILWDCLLDSRVFEDFFPYPDDSFEVVFGIAEEELEVDLIERLFDEFRLKLPENQLVLEFGVIDSARRVAQFVSRCRVAG